MKYKYHLLLHFTILIWGFTGVLGKHLDISGMKSMPIVVYRMLIGWGTLLIFMLIIKKSIKIAKQIERQEKGTNCEGIVRTKAKAKQLFLGKK